MKEIDIVHCHVAYRNADLNIIYKEMFMDKSVPEMHLDEYTKTTDSRPPHLKRKSIW